MMEDIEFVNTFCVTSETKVFGDHIQELDSL